MGDAEVIERLIERLRTELGPDLVGVLVGGSRLRGQAGPNSDLDVIVVVDRAHRRRWNVIIAGVEVEMFICPAFQLRRYFEEDRRSGRGLMPHLCGTGRVVFDPNGVMASLQSEALAIWDAGPPPITTNDHWLYRYLDADALRDLNDVLADHGNALFLIGFLLRQFVDQHYRISGRWLHKPKRLLDDLAGWDPVARAFAQRVCDEAGSINQRHAALCELADHVLAPLGGLMPIEWSIPWEDVNPPEPAPAIETTPVAIRSATIEDAAAIGSAHVRTER